MDITHDIVITREAWAKIEDVELQTTEAAKVLGVSRSTVIRSKIPFYKTDGGHRRYSLGTIIRVGLKLLGREDVPWARALTEWVPHEKALDSMSERNAY